MCEYARGVWRYQVVESVIKNDGTKEVSPKAHDAAGRSSFMIPSDQNLVTDKSQIEPIVRAVVRGEMAVEAVARLGITIDYEDGFYKLNSGNFDVTVMPTAVDVAMGILHYRSADGNDIRKWAFFLLAESGAIDLSGFESHPYGDTLLSALWDASFEGRLSNETIDLAERLKLVANDLC